MVVDNTASPADALSRQQVDYGALDRPAVTRQAGTRADTQASAASATGNAATAQPNVSVSLENDDMAYLDVPAFLRRQND